MCTNAFKLGKKRSGVHREDVKINELNWTDSSYMYKRKTYTLKVWTFLLYTTKICYKNNLIIYIMPCPYISVLTVVRKSQGNRKVNKVITRMTDTCSTVVPSAWQAIRTPCSHPPLHLSFHLVIVPAIPLEGFFSGTERLRSLRARSGLHDGWKTHYWWVHSSSYMAMCTAVGKDHFLCELAWA